MIDPVIFRGWGMFEITADDISRLNDTDLRELVGRLCEAELRSHGFPATWVTYGGNQTAGDGGLDVRVSIPPDRTIEGFIPRTASAFQVKAQDMPRGEIQNEMAPQRVLRHSIRELVDQEGAYIIVSSQGSVADGALRRRRAAMVEALLGLPNAERLHVEFYDRQRLATAVRQHPGLVLWVREKVGRPLPSWRPFGNWSRTGQDPTAEYLFDDIGRLVFHSDAPGKGGRHALPLLLGLNRLRRTLSTPGKVVRLVGLSGVGKTRLTQALFDARMGENALPPELAVYTNHEDQPIPSPIDLASQLLAKHDRAILVIDNCAPELHRRLSESCRFAESTVSVLTIEYDVREDLPEGTEVVSLEGASQQVVERLIRQRHPLVSRVNADTIAQLAGGNARIALALAGTVHDSVPLIGLADRELFNRLFWQGHAPQPELHMAAKVCALVYSFDGEALEGVGAELPLLATLAGQSVDVLYGHIVELERRDLLQRRGEMRAVLPHALSNRLASEALEEIPLRLIQEQVVENGSERLIRSFSRRLSFLSGHARTIELVRSWLSPTGMLGDVCRLSPAGNDLLVNVASVAPEEALAALERARECDPAEALQAWGRHSSLLRSLAYEEAMFTRSARLIAQSATHSQEEWAAREAKSAFTSLFTLHLSGTHAPVEMRLALIEGLMRSGDEGERKLGIEAMNEILRADHFTSHYPFAFGARPRDYGYRPKTWGEIRHWYCAALGLVRHLAIEEGVCRIETRSLLTEHFRELWVFSQAHNELAELIRAQNSAGFWREGWTACRETMHYDSEKMPPDALESLKALERDLQPVNLADQVQAIVFGGWAVGLELEGFKKIELGEESSPWTRLDEIARRLGTSVAVEPDVLAELLPDLMCGGLRIWSFGQGLATCAPDAMVVWRFLVTAYSDADPALRDARLLCGFLQEVAQQDRAVVAGILDDALWNPQLLGCLPQLHMAIGVDAFGVDRLIQAIDSGSVPADSFRYLALGRATDPIAGDVLRNLLVRISELPEGIDVAMDILHMRLYSDHSDGRTAAPELKAAGRELLMRCTFQGHAHREFHNAAEVAEACLKEPVGIPVAQQIALLLRQAAWDHLTHGMDTDALLAGLLRLHPGPVLSTLFSGTDEDLRASLHLLEPLRDHQVSPLASVTTETVMTWCEGDPDKLYPIAASLVPFTRREESGGQQLWTDCALALIQNAPDPEAVLIEFVDRFRPRGWSGSAADIIEAHGELLDQLPALLPEIMTSVIEGARAAFRRSVEHMRRWEAEMDSHHPEERFE